MQGFEKKKTKHVELWDKNSNNPIKPENTFWDCRFKGFLSAFLLSVLQVKRFFVQTTNNPPHEKRGEITEFLVPKKMIP